MSNDGPSTELSELPSVPDETSATTTNIKLRQKSKRNADKDKRTSRLYLGVGTEVSTTRFGSSFSSLSGALACVQNFWEIGWDKRTCASRFFSILPIVVYMISFIIYYVPHVFKCVRCTSRNAASGDVNECGESDGTDYEEFTWMENSTSPDAVNGIGSMCTCGSCSFVPRGPKVESDRWIEVREGDSWPVNHQFVRAMDKSLDTLPGAAADQYVALWFVQGEPVMGRVWNDGGKIAANFSWFNNEYSKNVGSIQLLVHLPDTVRGFDYGWIPFPDAAKFGDKEWHPVHVKNLKGDVSVGVVNVAGGKQILAKVDVYNTVVSFGYGGFEMSIRGQAAGSATTVLCRKLIG